MPANESLLSVENLRFRWSQDQREVLNIPSCEITRGERVFIKGESGTGKTTFLSLLAGISGGYTGEIRFLGTQLNQLRQRERDRLRSDHIGFIFQLFNLLPYLSVIDNIVLACKFSKSRTQKALLKSNSLEEEARRLLSHLQLDDPATIRKPVVELSVGQQQRVATARALIGSPELIVADEPTSALDADTRKHFLELMMRECEESHSTLLFVSHDSALEPLFDRTLRMSEINRANLASAGEVV